MVPLKHFDLRIASRTLVRASRPPPGFPAAHASPTSTSSSAPSRSTSSAPAVRPRRGALRRTLCPPGIPLPLLPLRRPHCARPGNQHPRGRLQQRRRRARRRGRCRAARGRRLRQHRALAGAHPGALRRGLCLVVQMVRFACGGFSLAVGTSHLLADGRALVVLLNSLTEMVRTGGRHSREPLFDGSLLSPRSPPRHSPSLDAEFARFTPGTMINPLLAAAIQRRLYRIEAADLAALQTAAATVSCRRPSRFVALCAHVWKLLARAVGESAPGCRMAWIVDGRECVEPSAGALDMYMGNVITYTSHEASVPDLLRIPLHDVAATVRAAITTVMNRDRFQDLVDWAEENKAAYKDGGKWTEEVNLGLGSPALVISGFVPFAIDGDLGFGEPKLVLPWLRHGRLGSAAMILVPCPSRDGSWFVEGTRLWPQLVEVVENVPESLLTPVTARSLGLEEPTGQHYSSRL